MKVYFKTVSGTAKQFSEDRVLVGKDVYNSTTDAWLIDDGIVAVADGVGGNRAGSVAAQQVCLMLAEYNLPKESDFKDINDRLLERSRSKDSWYGMATTLTGICVQKDKAYAFHVGNTRLYSIQAGMYLKQLTADDTVVEYLVRTGKITEEEALTHPKRNEITACFGGNSGGLLSVKMFDLDIEKQPLYLITCDGIHESLTVDAMEDIVADAHEDWAFAIEQFVSSAKANGSTDDCTAVIIDCRDRKEVNLPDGTEISEESENSAGSSVELQPA